MWRGAYAMQLLDLRTLPDKRLEDVRRQLSLYEQLSEDEGIHGLIEKAARLFNNPVTLLDPDLRLITRVVTKEDPLSLCHSLTLEGVCCDTCSFCFADEEIRRTVESASGAIYFEGQKPPSPARIFAKVGWGGRILAYLLVFECRGDLNTRSDLELADTLAKVISIVMRQRSAVTLFEEGEIGALLASILSGQQINRTMIEQRTAEAHLPGNTWYQMLYLPSMQGGQEFFGMDYFAKQLAERGRKPHYLFKDGAYLLIFKETDALAFRGLDVHLTAILKELKLQAALSERFSNLDELLRQLEICAKVYDFARVRDQKSQLHHLRSHIVGMLMCGYLESNDTSLIHPDIQLLSDYDLENNSQLLLSWVTYLKAHKHLINAAELLGIHKNTLVYRVKKIHELTVSIGDENDSISYQLLSYEKVMSTDRIIR